MAEARVEHSAGRTRNASMAAFALVVSIVPAAPVSPQDTKSATPPYVETVTQRVGDPTDSKVPAERLDVLDKEFTAGNMFQARAIAIEIIGGAKAGLPADACDYHKNYLALVWTAVDSAGQLAVRRLIVPQPVDRAYSLDLPGVGAARGLYELFVAADKRAILVTVYRSTREDNPLVAQLPAVASQIVGPLFGLAAGVAGEIRRAQAGGPQTQAKTLYVTASRVMLPFERCTVQAKSVVVVPETPERLRAAASLLATTLRLKDLAGLPFAQAYADKLASTVTKVAGGEPCTTEAAPAVECLRAYDAAFADALTECLEGCVQGSRPSNDDVKATHEVDAAFRDLVLAGGNRVSSDITFHNRPPTRVSLAAVTGFVLDGSLTKPRAKLDDNGVLAADPLGRLVTMVAFNWSPRGYDSEADAPSNAERYRVFAGAVITPDFGAGGGLSVLLVRGLALNLGAGIIFSRAVESAEAFGKPPANSKDPFAVGVATILFTGVSFNFK